MPWKEVDKVRSRIAFVEDALRGGRPFSHVCRDHGVSRPTGYEMLRRFHAGEALVDRSRRPHGHPMTTPHAVVERLIATKKRFPDMGPAKVRGHLLETEPWLAVPATSTIARYLNAAGLVKKRRRRRAHQPAPTSRQLTVAKGPNDVWAADFKGHFRLRGSGLRCHPLTVTDSYSRYLLGCRALDNERYGDSCRTMEQLFRHYGLPRIIRTDNGEPFSHWSAPAGLSRLSVWWLKLGIWPERIDPGKPQQNGRHERFHRTLKEHTAQPPRPSMRSQQRAFDRFRHYYNEVRPHASLGQKPPATRYEHAERRFHRPALCDYGELDTRKVRRDGTIRWCGKEVHISQVLAAERIGLLPMGSERFQLYFSAMPIGELELRGRFIPYR